MVDKQTPAPDSPDRHDGARYEHSVAPHVRRLRARAMRDRLRESQLFLPFLMLLGTVGIGILLIELDAHGVTRNAPRVFDLSPTVAITLLSTIAGAMITTAGVVFSILVVSLQLASGQFSPRVLRGFWRDRHTQVLIGLLLSTFAFCVLALTSINPSAGHTPHYMVSGSVLFTVASVAAIVIYLDRISRQQYVGRIMERVIDETLTLVAELPYGPRIGTRVGDPVPLPDLGRLGPPFVVRVPIDGWVQQISRHAAVGAVPPGTVLRLETRVGEYVTRDTPLAMMWPVPPAEDQLQIGRLLAEAVIIGRARTMQQDIEFGIRQLVDIGLRASSPAVNDDTTTIEIVLRLGSVLRPLLLADLPSQCVRDGEGRILLTPADLDHGEYVRQAYGQLRYYSATHPHVERIVLRTLRMLRTAVNNHPGRDQARLELDRQIELAVEGSARVGLLPGDRRVVEAAARE